MDKLQRVDKDNIPDDIPPQLVEVLEKAENPKEVISIIRSYSASWRGIMPPPDEFNKYSKAVQKEMVAQATAQMKHRQKIEEKVIKSNVDATKSGMRYAFYLSFLLIGGGIILLAVGKTVEGLGLAGTTSIFHGGNYIYQQFKEANKTHNKIKDENNGQVRQTD